MNQLQRINKIVKKTNVTDFHIQSYDGVELLITGSFDFAYYHQIEIEFQEVSYISLPTNFYNPIFRLANTIEVDSTGDSIYIKKEDIIYCIEAETNKSIKRIPFYIVAEKMTIKEGTVFYYERENLKENERIASWVKRTN